MKRRWRRGGGEEEEEERSWRRNCWMFVFSVFCVCEVGTVRMVGRQAETKEMEGCQSEQAADSQNSSK